jgi:hypothetical protein
MAKNSVGHGQKVRIKRCTKEHSLGEIFPLKDGLSPLVMIFGIHGEGIKEGEAFDLLKIKESDGEGQYEDPDCKVKIFED